MSTEDQQSRDARIEALQQEPDVAAAIASAKAHLAPQCLQFGIEPEVYVVEACGLPCVLLPWAGSKRMIALRAAASLPDMEKGLKLADAVVIDCLWWIRGQKGDDRKAALTHARGLVDLVGGRYMNLMLMIGSTTMDILGASEGAQAAGKKL